jgi:hypothetical protein
MNYTLDTVPDDFKLNNSKLNIFAIYAIIGCMFYSIIELFLIDMDNIFQHRNTKFAFNFFLFICSMIALSIEF